MSNDTCVWPKCYNRPWVARGLPICGPHAEDVAYIMKPEKRPANPHYDTCTEILASIDQQKIPTEQAAARRKVDGHIYYVQVGAHVKIGWTSNLQSRMRKYPPNSVLLAIHPGTRRDEAQMHRRFAADRTHGREWYVPSVSLTHHIQQMVAQHGQPEQVTFGAKPLTVKGSTSTPVGASSTRWGRAI